MITLWGWFITLNEWWFSTARMHMMVNVAVVTMIVTWGLFMWVAREDFVTKRAGSSDVNWMCGLTVVAGLLMLGWPILLGILLAVMPFLGTYRAALWYGRREQVAKDIASTLLEQPDKVVIPPFR